MFVVHTESIDFSDTAKRSEMNFHDTPVQPIHRRSVRRESFLEEDNPTWIPRSSSNRRKSNCLSSYCSMETKFFFRSISGSISLKFSVGSAADFGRVGTLIFRRFYTIEKNITWFYFLGKWLLTNGRFITKRSLSISTSLPNEIHVFGTGGTYCSTSSDSWIGNVSGG